MSFHKKALLPLAAAVATTAVIAAGCAKDEPAAGNTSNPTAASSAAATPTPYVRGDISVSVYDRGSVPPAEGTIESNRWTKWLNENGPANVKFVAVPRFESQQKLNVLFASSSAPDLIFEYDPGIKNSFYDQRLMRPIDDMVEKYSVEYKEMMKKYPQLKKVGTMPDGKLYQFAKLGEATPIYMAFIRSDWLKKLNLEMPRTTEDLYKVAKAFTEQDPDGNGKKDTLGVNISSNAFYFINMMFKGTDWAIENDQMVRNWENIRLAVEFQKRLFDEGLVDKDFATDKNGAKAKQDFANGKLGIYLATPIQWTNFAMNEYATLKKTVPTAELDIMNMLKSPAGQFNFPLNNPIQATAFVNSKTKNPEAVMKYVDFLVKPDTGKTLNMGIVGEHAKVGANGCLEQIDAAKSKNEVSYNGDFQMLYSKVLDTKCGAAGSGFNLNDPNQAIVKVLFDKAIAMVDPKKELPWVTHQEHFPTLPKDLQEIHKSLSQPYLDTLTKAVLGGKQYNADQAIADAKAAWEKAGGKQIEDWYKKWYAENKNTAFLSKDIVEMERVQHGK